MKAKRTVDLPWHPNFREESTLPDIRAVRPVFFVNFLLLTIMLISLGYWLYVELQISTVSGLMKKDKENISVRQKNNAALLKISREFEQHDKTIGEIRTFIAQPFVSSDFISQVGFAMEGPMILESLDYRFEGRKNVTKDKDGKKHVKNYTVCLMEFSGTVSGSSGAATASIEAFRQNLRKLSIFKSMKDLGEPVVTNFLRDGTLNVYKFTVEMEGTL